MFIQPPLTQRHKYYLYFSACRLLTCRVSRHPAGTTCTSYYVNWLFWRSFGSHTGAVQRGVRGGRGPTPV